MVALSITGARTRSSGADFLILIPYWRPVEGGGNGLQVPVAAGRSQSMTSAGNGDLVISHRGDSTIVFVAFAQALWIVQVAIVP